MEIDSISKMYRIKPNVASYGRLTESLSDSVRRLLRPSRTRASKANVVWALRDVSMSIDAGEAIGIVGPNGAGKTTLLKILSRITEPTSGRATLSGRVGSLLEVGTGFHPELSGRENIFLNGAILGMSSREIRQRFDDIVSFAEVGRFIDTPVKRFSSGMQVRLAFAVAAHLEPDILVVDEVLAVGDASFQGKCMGKMSEVATGGRTVLFVSHNMAAVRALCDRAFLLDRGRVASEGSVDAVLTAYADRAASAITDLEGRADRQGDGRIRFEHFSTSSEGAARSLICGAPAVFRITYSATKPMRNVHISMAIRTVLGEPVAYLGNDTSGDWFDELPGSGAFECRLERLPLLPGTYLVTLYSSVGGVTADWVTDAATIEVGSGDFFESGRLPSPRYGLVLMPHRWSVSLSD